MTQPSINGAPTLAGEWLIFRTGAQEYGISILRVQELRGYEPGLVTRVAHAPHCVLGLINLRGQIIPVIDLRIKMGVHEVTVTEQTVIMILNLDGRMLGAVVDSVSDVLYLTEEAIKPAPRSEDMGHNRHLCGLAEHECRLIQLLNIEGLLGGQQRDILELSAEGQP